MTYNEALGVIVYGSMFAAFVVWYGWCVFTMLVVCRSPREFFSDAYSSSVLFFLVNAIGSVLGSAWLLMKFTN